VGREFTRNKWKNKKPIKWNGEGEKETDPKCRRYIINAQHGIVIPGRS